MKYLLFATALLMIILILIFPQSAKENASEAAEMWFAVLIPSLMPYCAASSIIVKTGILSRLVKPLNRISVKLTGFSGNFIYVYITSFLSGYPNGAFLTGELYSSGVINEREAAAMVNASSLCGPSFIICAVSSGMLGDISLSKYIILAHILSSFITAVLNGKMNKFSPSLNDSYSMPSASSWEIITDSISKASISMLNILGFTVVLTVACGLVVQIFSSFFETHPLILALFTGIIEMTGGCLMASKLDIPTALTVISFLISFGGISVICQTVSAAKQHNLKTQRLITSKMLQGLISAAITFIYLRISPPTVSAFLQTENTPAVSLLPQVICLLISCIGLMARKFR